MRDKIVPNTIPGYPTTVVVRPPTQNNVALLTTDQIEAAWLDTCPGCRQAVSAIKHDFSLCSQLQNALYRIRKLEEAHSKKRKP